MKWTPPPREARITWEPDHIYHGAEVTLSLDAPAGLLFRLQGFPTADGEQRAAMVREFGDAVLMDWNADAEATGEGLLSMPMAFVDSLFEQWIGAQGVDAPLAGNSPSSTTSARARLAKTGKR